MLLNGRIYELSVIIYVLRLIKFCWYIVLWKYFYVIDISWEDVFDVWRSLIGGLSGWYLIDYKYGSGKISNLLLFIVFIFGKIIWKVWIIDINLWSNFC